MIIILLVFSLLSCKISFCMNQSLPYHLSLELAELESEVMQTSTNTVPTEATEQAAEQDEIAIGHPTDHITPTTHSLHAQLKPQMHQTPQESIEYWESGPHSSQRVTCIFCVNPRTFQNTRNYKRHLASAHKAQSKKSLFQTFCCEFCEKNIFRLDQLDKHLQRMHTDEKQIKCTACNELYIGDERAKLHKDSDKHEKTLRRLSITNRPDSDIFVHLISSALLKSSKSVRPSKITTRPGAQKLETKKSKKT